MVVVPVAVALLAPITKSDPSPLPVILPEIFILPERVNTLPFLAKLPARVRVPVPLFSTMLATPLPLGFEATISALRVTFELPAEISNLALLVPPLDPRVTSLVPRALTLVTFTVPAPTSVVPEKFELSPERVKVPFPVLASVPEPVIVPDDSPLATVRVVLLEPRVKSPPLSVDTVTSAFKVIAPSLISVTVVVPAIVTVPDEASIVSTVLPAPERVTLPPPIVVISAVPATATVPEVSVPMVASPESVTLPPPIEVIAASPAMATVPEESEPITASPALPLLMVTLPPETVVIFAAPVTVAAAPALIVAIVASPVTFKVEPEASELTEAAPVILAVAPDEMVPSETVWPTGASIVLVPDVTLTGASGVEVLRAIVTL